MLLLEHLLVARTELRMARCLIDQHIVSDQAVASTQTDTAKAFEIMQVQITSALALLEDPGFVKASDDLLYHTTRLD